MGAKNRRIPIVIKQAKKIEKQIRLKTSHTSFSV